MSTTTEQHPVLVKRDEAIERYKAARAAADKAKATGNTKAMNKANGAVSGPKQSILNAEAALFEAGVEFTPFEFPASHSSRDSWNEEEARKAISAKLAVRDRAAKAPAFAHLVPEYDKQLDRAFKAAKEHGVSIKDPR